MSATSKRNRALRAGLEPVTGKDLQADMAIDMAAAPEVTDDPPVADPPDKKEEDDE